MGKITIKDIAKRANVSPGTVSKIITGKYKEDKVQISQATIEKVQKIIKELNYTPNYGARLLSTGRTDTIGIYMPKSILPTFSLEHYYSTLIHSIGKNSISFGYDILLINHGSYIQKLDTKRIDALIIIEQCEIDKGLEYLIEMEYPFIIINNLLDEDIPIASINIDNSAGVNQVVNFFKEHNHRSLAYIGELIPEPQKEHLLRLHYFKTYLEKASMEVNEELFLIGSSHGLIKETETEYFNQMSGYYGMKYLFQHYRDKFTGIFCANDIIALGALNYLYESNVRIPDELSIIGFDDVDFAAYLMGGLTTVRQPAVEMSKAALERLVSILKNPEDAEKKIQTILPEFIRRKTVAMI
ncbi:MAG: LacI family DNA-binding transcriptional regulator [Spirochaetales bacterium]|nr:LacI family DNA-binding transcriptional regulator [Spirochaetales bacterium]